MQRRSTLPTQTTDKPDDLDDRFVWDFFDDVPLGTVFSFEASPLKGGLRLQEIEYDTFCGGKVVEPFYKKVHLFVGSPPKNIYAILIDTFILPGEDQVKCGVFLRQDLRYTFMMSERRIHHFMNWSSHAQPY
jgi:hypothetical protein